jgi:hypothetical protein
MGTVIVFNFITSIFNIVINREKTQFQKFVNRLTELILNIFWTYFLFKLEEQNYFYPLINFESNLDLAKSKVSAFLLYLKPFIVNDVCTKKV